MNFFERQRQVRRMSVRLVLLFALAVIGIVIVVDIAVAFALSAADAQEAQLAMLMLVSSVVVLVSIGLASLVRTAALRGGGGRVARELGGQLVPANTSDPQLRRLRNVVEEMAIAAGVAVPEIYILRHERAINAFAAGWSTSDAAIAVTQGTLDRLNRDELQGVIAHEFSHVVNGDMRLNIRLIGLLFGILFLSIIGRGMLEGSFFAGARNRDGKSETNPLLIIGIALLAAGGIGVLVGRIIQASVSRQREYLADASAVQFTRQTSGIAGALKKIGGLGDGSKLRSPKRDEVGHMLFGSGAGLHSLFATHPPLADRIKALEPSFNPAELEQLSRQWADHPPSGMQEDLARGLTEPGGTPPTPAAPPVSPGAAASRLPDVSQRLPFDASGLVDQIATLTQTAQTHAGDLIGQIPGDILERARDTDTVVPLMFGLLLSDQHEVRAAQHAVLSSLYSPHLAESAAREAASLATLHPALLLPLAQLAFPALRERSPEQRQHVLVAVSQLIHADDQITVFEYCAARLVYRELDESMRPYRAQGRQSLAAHLNEAAILLATLAHAGNADPRVAGPAFTNGMSLIAPGTAMAYVPPPRGVLELEPGWPALDSLAPEAKQRLISAVAAVIGYDGVVTLAEAELLRTVCALVHCTLPPLTAHLDAAR